MALPPTIAVIFIRIASCFTVMAMLAAAGWSSAAESPALERMNFGYAHRLLCEPGRAGDSQSVINNSVAVLIDRVYTSCYPAFGGSPWHKKKLH